MILNIMNQSDVKVPRQFLNWWAKNLKKQLVQKKILQSQNANKSLTLVFLNPVPAKKMNFQFRKKNYATDVLSFDSMDEESFGELILCPQVLTKQAKEHGLLFREELAYMMTHGMLHLLGYDHETSERDAEIMFSIQDEIFDRLLKTYDTQKS